MVPPIRSPSPSSSAHSQMELFCYSKDSGRTAGLVLCSCNHGLRLFTLLCTHGCVNTGTPTAASTITTAGTQTDARGHGASPPTQTHPGSTATSEFVVNLLVFWIEYTYSTSFTGCVCVELS